eukprot:5898517-Karenia_brevis.AAC.1
MRWDKDEIMCLPNRTLPLRLLDHDSRYMRWREMCYRAVESISDALGDENIKSQIVNGESNTPTAYFECACKMFTRLT